MCSMLAMSVLERLSYVATILDRWQVLAVSGCDCHCRDLLLKDLSGTVKRKEKKEKKRLHLSASI